MIITKHLHPNQCVFWKVMYSWGWLHELIYRNIVLEFFLNISISRFAIVYKILHCQNCGICISLCRICTRTMDYCDNGIFINHMTVELIGLKNISFHSISLFYQLKFDTTLQFHWEYLQSAQYDIFVLDLKKLDF